MNNTKTNEQVVQDEKDNLYKGLIGQEKPKNELRFHLENFWQTSIIPHLLFIAPRGQGKTTIATETAKGLFHFDDDGKAVVVPRMIPDGNGGEVQDGFKVRKKKFLEINCSTLTGGVEAFINTLAKDIVDKDVTVFFDEASEIPHDVSMALLSMLNENPSNKNTFVYHDYACEIDFARQSFIFATTESHRIFHALKDRLERITLQEYSLQNMADIVKKHAPTVQFRDGVENDVATVLRGNARAAFRMSQKIKSFTGDRAFDNESWAKMRQRLSIYPLGLNNIELQVLKFMEHRTEGMSLTNLAAKTGMSRESLQKDAELYLMKHNLMEVHTGGRQITHDGRTYLKNLGANALMTV